MQQDRWQRMQRLFEQAIALEPDARAEFLKNVEADPALRREVMAMLRADDGADAVDGVIQRAASQVATHPMQGARIGPWVLMEELGAGGMGTVFRAERADGAYARTVAIKFLRGIPTRDGAERMRRERQILADLDHPNIAGLLDGGTTDEGQPYIVMEHVEGEEVTVYAQGRPVDERLKLIRQIARGLHFAHQHLVIHRDLKPANVLVRADGTPVLLDFGIAKLLDADTDADGRTQAWFTPGYASPEQRRGEAVSTAGDIYSLGQLMAEVLGGEYRTPLPSGDIVPPSQRGGLAGLSARRRRELDAIATHAGASRPRDRYPSAEAMADDIDRYFSHQPLRAAPARPLYLLGKFLRRHRYAVSTATLFVAAIGVFTWRLASERDRALRAETEAVEQTATAEHVVEYLVSLFQEASPEQAGNRPILPAELVDRGRARIDEQLAGEPLQQAKLLGVLGRIDSELGRSDKALESLRAATAIERKHGTARRVAENLLTMGILENQNERPQAAREAFEESLKLFDGEPDADESVSYALGGLALAELRMGDVDAARASAMESLRVAERSAGPESEIAAQAWQVIAELDSRTGEDAQAVAAASRALAIVRNLYPDGHAEIARGIGFLANAYVQDGDYAQAEPLFREMLAIRLRTLDPGSTWVITARHNLAQTIYDQGRILEALPLMQENVDLMRARGETDTPSYLIALNNVASLHELTGNYQESIRQFNEIVSISEKRTGSEIEPRLPMYRQNYGRSLMLNGRLDDAWRQISPEIGGTVVIDDAKLQQGRRFLHLGEWMRRSRRFDEAEDYLDRADDVFRAELPDTHPRVAGVMRSRGWLAADQGRMDDAERLLRESLRLLEGALGSDSNVTVETRIALADVLLRTGKRAEARALIAASSEVARRLFVPSAPVLADLARLETKLR
jgi:serine/threonine-protein kinase